MNKGNEKSIFIGARTLKKGEVNIIVPTFDAIINRIEDIRREAGNARKEKHDNYIKKYNNTITLFGNRGTGKTSTMYTIRNELNKNKKNILLQIIEPDNIGQEGKIMGCILGLFKHEIDKLQKEIKNKNPQYLPSKIKKDFFQDCRFKENNSLKQAYNEVLEYYCYTEKEYKTLLTSNYNDMNSYIKKSSHIFNADIEFAKKFEEFINEFIQCKKSLNDNEKEIEESNINNEPLIFMFIDDVDLNTNKCQEIIEAILKYASHPNIVCIITGDYNTFTEEFIISLLKKENLNEANLWPNTKINNEKTILKSKQELAHEYMKKVFPPAYRHYVNSWNLSLIPKYRFAIEDDENTENLFQLLSQISEHKFIENIFGYYSENEDKIKHFLPAYNMFDRTSRGLINVYYSLWNIKDNINKYIPHEYFVNVKNLIENIIDSSSFLVKYNEEIKKKYILWGAEEEQSKIDFDQLQNLFEDKENQESISNDRNNVEIKYSLFYICYYISILLPKIQYSIEKRKKVFKFAMLQLVANPKLNGYEIDMECDSLVKSYFLDEPIYYYYTYNINLKGFICQILSESNLSFAQRFYDNIVSSDLLGYEVFGEGYKVSDEKYNSLLITFYKSLYKDINQDIPILMNFHANNALKQYVKFLQNKSSEEKDFVYIEEIFKEVFEGFNEKINIKANNLENEEHKQSLIGAREEFLLLLKLEFKRICSENYGTIIANDFIECTKNILNDFEQGISKQVEEYYINVEKYYKEEIGKVQDKSALKRDLENSKSMLTLSNLIYKVHKNEINNKNQGDDKKENFYTNLEIFNAITKLITQLYGYFIADIFLNDINKIKVNDEYEGFFKLNLANGKIIDKFNKFFKSYDGVTNTKVYEIKKNFKRDFKKKFKGIENDKIEGITDSLNIEEYYNLKKALNDLWYSNAHYGKEEAKELIDALNNDVKIEIDNKSLFTQKGEWVLQAYSLYIQKAKPNIADISELEEAKTYLKEVLPKAIAMQEEKEKDYLKKLGIGDKLL